MNRLNRWLCWLWGHRRTAGIARVRGGMGIVEACQRCGQRRRLV